MDLGSYRRSAEAFIAALTTAYYRHYAGLEERYEIEPVYARHRELFERSAVEGLREAHDAAAAGEDRRRLRMLLDFAVEGYLGQTTKHLEAERAEREARATVTVAGAALGFREAAVVQANESDPERRAAIDAARMAVTEAQLTPLDREVLERHHEAARELGFATYREMCEVVKELDLTELHRSTQRFTAASEESYPRLLGPEVLRVLGVEFARLRRSDLPRFFRAADDDRFFPADRLIPSLLETLSGLGLADEGRVVLDVEPRSGKSPRAFCAPVHVPEQVYLVISPVGGRDDFGALFHEAGHAQHYAHVDPGLAFEFRWLGDNTITETFAFLLQHLTENALWLERRLGIAPDAAAALVSFARAHRLVYLRRYAGKLTYELELHSGESSLDELPDRYAELLRAALHVPWAREMWLSDVDPGFYSACYLRAWALESHVRGHLVDTFGPLWFETPAAGEVLRTLWRSGQRHAPDELLHELTGERPDFLRLLADVGVSAAAQ